MTMSTTDHNDDITGRFWREVHAHRDEPAASGEPFRVRRDDPSGRPEGVGRRRFLQLLGTSVAIPSLAACTRQPREEIVPYVKQPEEIVPGRPLFYATATSLGGVATGVLVETHMGRPTKVEGNPEHPTSLGGTDAIAQAEILQLYDPDRSQTVLHEAEISSWGAFASAIHAAVLKQRTTMGAGLRILTGEVTSPTLIRQIDDLLNGLPGARWHVHEPVDNEAERLATNSLFGRALEARYEFDKADVVLSLDADFLGSSEGNARYMRDFASGRGQRADGGTLEMTRLYALQSAPTITSANADHRAVIKASAVEHVARLIAAAVLRKRDASPAGAASADQIAQGAVLPASVTETWVNGVVEDLLAAKAAVVVPGRFQPAIVHRLAHTLNTALGAVGRTMWFGDPVRISARGDIGTLPQLASALHAGKVELLVVLGTNPVYDAPGDIEFGAAMEKATLRIHHGMHFDETAALAHWHVPASHPFEMWSDVRSYDGTVSIVQPMIEPLYANKSEHEVLAVLSAEPDRSSYDVVRGYWKQLWPGQGFDEGWRRMVHDGLLGDSRSSAVTDKAFDVAWPAASPVPDALEIVLRPDPCVYDGRFANNGWLQELPKPLTKLTWDNAAMFSRADARKHGLTSGDVVRLSMSGRRVEATVWELPGQPAGSVTVHLGYGRQRGGKVLAKAGFNAYLIRPSVGETAMWHAAGLEFDKTGKTNDLAAAQIHSVMEGRDLAKSKPVGSYRADPHVFEGGHGGHHEVRADGTSRSQLYPDHEYKGYSWGMSIDLANCIGCSACVTACQSENNVPIVGREEVLVGREMHWIRIDRYYAGADGSDPSDEELDDPDTRFMPVPCMHCERAPCEVVCPVQATVHHDEGLNDMVYNRCVGTKYCSNNCPYKVRRFNFFPYSVEPIAPLDPTAASMKLLHNPDVTVRTYGVMEKCSYCVQRINYARVGAKREGRKIADGDVMTACQAACPARAISFGDMNDAASDVSKRKKEARDYSLLAELNTKPHTTYLAHLSNPNPNLDVS